MLCTNFLLTLVLFKVVTAIRNMARQHREFQSRLDDIEKLRLYARLATSHHQTLSTSLVKAKSSTEHWEKEAKDGMANVTKAEKERDEAKKEARVAQLVTTSTRDSKARVEVDLSKALDYLVTAEEGRCRLEAKITCLETELARIEVERTLLLLELEASKGEVSSLHARASKDREDMVTDYQGSLELIFAYGYGCCAFKNDIRGDLPKISDGMPNSASPLPPEFFVNPRCPPNSNNH